jgi:hypothetical protein
MTRRRASIWRRYYLLLANFVEHLKPVKTLRSTLCHCRRGGGAVGGAAASAVSQATRPRSERLVFLDETGASTKKWRHPF